MGNHGAANAAIMRSENSMKILVTGAAGMLGSKMMAVVGVDHEVSGTDLVETEGISRSDITDAGDILALVQELQPEVIIHCAAYTAVDDCEKFPELAHAVNGQGTRNVATAAEAIGAEVFYISTDYVFDGDKEDAYIEEDPPNPTSVYGSSKLEGEIAIQEVCSKWYIGRTQWLYGEGGANFAETMIRLGSERDVLKVVDDQWGAPTYTKDLASEVKTILEAKAYGLYHLSNEGKTTWYGFARAVLELAGIQVSIQPCTTEDFPRPAKRPRNSVMWNRSLKKSVGNVMRDWKDGLREYMKR
jgi:dTDP-4-dehydrorhamnose reductase